MNKQEAKMIALKILVEHKKQILDASEEYVQNTMTEDTIEDISKVQEEIEKIFEPFEDRLSRLENN